MSRIDGRIAAACAGLAFVASVAGWMMFHDEAVPVAATTTDTPMPLPVQAPPVETAPVVRSAHADIVAVYASMRDDVNPKPRLQLIDAWARQVRRGDDLTLLSQAMVDPDASVREHAILLFDREVARR